MISYKSLQNLVFLVTVITICLGIWGESQSTSSRPDDAAKEETPLPEEKTLDVFSVGDINSVEKKEATEAFRKFLEEKAVPSNINWENCVKIIQSDKRFDVWKKFSDRKQAFNQYKIQKQVRAYSCNSCMCFSYFVIKKSAEMKKKVNKKKLKKIKK